MNQQQKVINYYKNFESKWGYTFLTWDTKHFGYYPTRKRDIHEKEAQRLMVDLLAKKLKLVATDIVLDAGCGRGTTSCYLAQKYNVNIIGIDLVPFELEIAKQKAQKLKLNSKTKFYLKDYSHTNFSSNYFDKIFTLETLVHSPNIIRTLKEFSRILKPEGIIALFEYSLSQDKDFNPWERKMIHLINDGSAMMSLGKMYHNKLPEYIKEAGLKVISNEDITSYMLPSAERFYNYAKVPYLMIRSLRLQKMFINTTAGVEFYQMLKKGLVKYRIITAIKI